MVIGNVLDTKRGHVFLNSRLIFWLGNWKRAQKSSETCVGRKKFTETNRVADAEFEFKCNLVSVPAELLKVRATHSKLDFHLKLITPILLPVIPIMKVLLGCTKPLSQGFRCF